jgi:hypothetical protein
MWTPPVSASFYPRPWWPVSGIVQEFYFLEQRLLLNKGFALYKCRVEASSPFYFHYPRTQRVSNLTQQKISVQLNPTTPHAVGVPTKQCSCAWLCRIPFQSTFKSCHFCHGNGRSWSNLTCLCLHSILRSCANFSLGTDPYKLSACDKLLWRLLRGRQP